MSNCHYFELQIQYFEKSTQNVAFISESFGFSKSRVLLSLFPLQWQKPTSKHSQLWIPQVQKKVACEDSKSRLYNLFTEIRNRSQNQWHATVSLFTKTQKRSRNKIGANKPLTTYPTLAHSHAVYTVVHSKTGCNKQIFTFYAQSEVQKRACCTLNPSLFLFQLLPQWKITASNIKCRVIVFYPQHLFVPAVTLAHLETGKVCQWAFIVKMAPKQATSAAQSKPWGTTMFSSWFVPALFCSLLLSLNIPLLKQTCNNAVEIGEFKWRRIRLRSSGRHDVIGNWHEQHILSLIPMV